jgi:hypothetical protein
MSANQLQTPAVAYEIAVSETVKQVSAEALELLTRRKQLNQRILRIRRTMRGLGNLATKAIVGNSAPTTQARAAERDQLRNHTIPSRRTGGQMDSSLPGWSRSLKVALTRACRIALLEAGGTASTDDIRRLIVRRGSFTFPLATYEAADAAIIRTLKAMTHSGEVRGLAHVSESLWQRTAQDRES